jgi:hypothetical protein
MVTQHGVHRSGFVCLIHENAPTEAKFRATDSYFLISGDPVYCDRQLGRLNVRELVCDGCRLNFCLCCLAFGLPEERRAF